MVHLGDHVDLVIGESREFTEPAGETDRALVALAACAAEAEQLVDDLLELERLGAPFRIILGDLAQPVRAHLHVGDLVGEHPVLAELEVRVAGEIAELLHLGEHVDRQALEGAVDTGEPQDRIVRAGRLEQDGVLRELSEFGAHPGGQLDADLHVPRLVPRLARHVELEFEGDRVVGAVAAREVVRRAPGALEGLDLADHDPVHQRAGGVGCVGPIGREPRRRGAALGRRSRAARRRVLDARLAGVLHPFGHVRLHEAFVSGEILDWEELAHQVPPYSCLRSCSIVIRCYPGP